MYKQGGKLIVRTVRGKIEGRKYMSIVTGKGTSGSYARLAAVVVHDKSMMLLLKVQGFLPTLIRMSNALNPNSEGTGLKGK